MSYKNTQDRRGTPLTKSTNPTTRTGRSDGSNALAGDGAISTNYPNAKSSYSGKAKGVDVENRVRRGYIRNEGNQSTGEVKSANVASDGTKRLKKL